jgi:cell division protein ZapD
MQHDEIIFQLATHYLPKIALKLERLLSAVEQARLETHPIIHDYALKNIIEIIKLIEKPELKSRFIKELMRIEHVVNKSNIAIPNGIYAKLFVQIQLLTHMIGPFGEIIHHDPFLQSINSTQPRRVADYELESPKLLLWLENDASKRQQDLEGWLLNLQHLADTVHVYLSILRHSAIFQTITFSHGFYQQSLPSNIPCQLILLRMNKHLSLVPKIQLGHQNFSVKLFDAHAKEVCDRKINLELAICQL